MGYVILIIVILMLIYVFSLFLTPFIVYLLKKFKKSIERIPSRNKLIGNQEFKYKAEEFIILKAPQTRWPGFHYTRHKYLNRNKIDVLIPAHNEEQNIAITIEFIRKACNQNGIECRIIVGLDVCNDKSAEVVKNLADVVIGISYRSKWKTLNHLLKFTVADWVAFVDVGAIWNSEFILEFQKYQQIEDLMFIAPGYKQIGASKLQSANWSLECLLKSIENRVGGPVTVHGATVFYRQKLLKQTLDYLASNEEWFNDDVIIPLTMRALFPDLRGVYLNNVAVLDLPIQQVAGNRRSRISFGNLQVLEFIENNKIELDTMLSMLWSRRKFRIFWAYFLSLAVLLAGLIIPGDAQLKFIFMICFISPCLASKAFRASILALIELFKLKLRKTVNTANVKWK